MSDFLHTVSGTQDVSVPWWAKLLAGLFIAGYVLRRLSENGYPLPSRRRRGGGK